MSVSRKPTGRSDEYWLLDDLPDSHGLPVVPSELWILMTLEIVVRDQFGSYLLLTLPSYPLASEGLISATGGYWALPFCGFPVDRHYVSPENVGAVRRLFTKREDTINWEDQIDHLAYIMGLTNPEYERVTSFIELKRSPRSPETFKCYKIVRYCLKSSGQRGSRNLADPDCRKGYSFLPLDRLKEVIVTRRCDAHGRSEWLYLSRPIMSNIVHVLQSDAGLKTLLAHSVLLERADFYREEVGILSAIDLAGYGAACKYASEHMGSFGQRGAQIATTFRESVAHMFYAMCARAGISQAHMAGDGMICALPQRLFDGRGTKGALSDLLGSYNSFLDDIETLNSYISDTAMRVGSRIALHWGEYRFGRIAQARSLGAEFDGANIVAVARLEAGLREFTKGALLSGPVRGNHGAITARSKKSVEGGKRPLLRLKHSMTCSPAMLTASCGFFEHQRMWSKVSQLRIGIKEAAIAAQVFKRKAATMSGAKPERRRKK